MKTSCPHCHYEYEFNQQSNPGYIRCRQCGKPFLAIKKMSTRPCPMCGEMINFSAKKCRFCGEYFDDAGYPIKKNDRVVYILLALFLGGIGIHNFYAGENQIGCLHIAMTFVTVISIFLVYQGIGFVIFMMLLLLHSIWVIFEMITGHAIIQMN